MDNSCEKYHELLCSIIQLLLVENESMRHSMCQIDSLLKHAFELLNENECYVNIALQTKLNSLKNVYADTQATMAVDNESNEAVMRLNKMLSNATQLFQVEDIVAQIVQHIINRSLTIDTTLSTISQASQNNNASIDELIKGSLDKINELRNTKSHNAIKQTNLHPGDIELF